MTPLLSEPDEGRQVWPPADDEGVEIGRPYSGVSHILGTALAVLFVALILGLAASMILTGIVLLWGVIL